MAGCWSSTQAYFKTAWARISSLKTCPRELWFSLASAIFIAFGDFGLGVVTVLYLQDLGFSALLFILAIDQQAGLTYGIYGALTTLYGLITGFIIDLAGIRVAMILGLVIMSGSRFALAFLTNVNGVYACLYFFSPLGEAMGTPVLSNSLKRYTTLPQRSIAYGLLYSCVNIGVVLTAWNVDLIRKFFGGGAVLFGMQLSAYRIAIFSFGIAVMIPLVFAVFVRDINVNEEGKQEKTVATKEPPWTIIKEVLTQKSFWKYILLATLLANVRALFRHLKATLPTYMIRTFGKDAPYGVVYSLNPIIIIFMTAAAQTFSFKLTALVAIIIGTAISSLSPAWMAIMPHVGFCVMFVIQLSIGEILWSPRVMSYGLSVAPKGKEGTFSAIASIPLSLSKLPAGIISGLLLQHYCYSEGNCNGMVVWLVVAAIAITTPLGILAFYKVIYDPAADRARNAEQDHEKKDTDGIEYVRLEEIGNDEKSESKEPQVIQLDDSS